METCAFPVYISCMALLLIKHQIIWQAISQSTFMSAITHCVTSWPSYCISTWLGTVVRLWGKQKGAEQPQLIMLGCVRIRYVWTLNQVHVFLPREPMRTRCSMWFTLRCVWRPHLPACHLGRASRTELLQLHEVLLPRRGILLKLRIGWITAPTACLPLRHSSRTNGANLWSKGRVGEDYSVVLNWQPDLTMTNAAVPINTWLEQHAFTWVLYCDRDGWGIYTGKRGYLVGQGVPNPFFVSWTP